MGGARQGGEVGRGAPVSLRGRCQSKQDHLARSVSDHSHGVASLISKSAPKT